MKTNITIERVLLGAILILCALMYFAKSGNIGVARDASRFDSDVYIANTLEVAGATTLTGAVTLPGGTTATKLTQSGIVSVISTSSATYTLAASDICNNSYTLVQPLGAVTTVTLPATSTLFASCLPNVGDFKDSAYQSIGTSTILAAGAGGTLNYSASTTIAAGKHALLRFMHDTTNTLDVYLVNVAN